MDSKENVFFADYFTSVYMLPAGASTYSTVATEGSSKVLLVIDSEGSLYYNDNIGGLSGRVLYLDPLPFPSFGSAQFY